MITVVVYGRNDHHGYNFHKRAAISLNCLAELLTDPDDEIIFTDYNTPNDYPTLIEAIRDTLTDRCRRRLRVLRVRPDVHERFRDRTHLEVVESVSRNAAVRRSNPANRWILSTNTDMIFVARDARRSLSDIAAARPDGFYQLPRFEIPETLWESFDRRDPRGIMETVRRWGTELHLNEVVHTDAFARFDGIGDCQLVLRKDLFAIHGFHEGMLVGWNVDMNLCRRLRRIHDETGSLLEDLFGYHCDHTRKPTAALSAAAIQNDPRIFIDGVTRPDVPEQAETWGLAGEAIEEHRGFDLPADRYVAALGRDLPPLGQPYRQAHNDRSAFFGLSYPPEHVLPYASDHLTTLPQDAEVGVVGGAATMVRLLAALWRGMGGRGRILVPETLGDVLRGVDDPAVAEAVPLEVLHRRASLFVVDLSLEPDDLPAAPIRGANDLSPAARARLGRIKGCFNRLVALERRAPAPAGPRKFVCLNAINTHFGVLARTELLFTWTPFTTRVCFGPVRPDEQPVAPARSGAGSVRALETALGRRFAIDPWELSMLRGDVAAIVSAIASAATGGHGLDAIEPCRFSAPLLAQLSAPDAEAALGLDAGTLAVLHREAERRRPSAALRPRVDPRFAAPDGAAPERVAFSKLAAAEDWESAAWRIWAERLTREGLGYIVSTYNYFKRSRGVWERAQYLYALEALGALRLDARVAVLSPAPDGLYLFLADRVERVDAVPLEPANGLGAAEWLAKNRLFDPDHLTVHPAGLAAPALASAEWDAVVVTQGALLPDGSGLSLERALERLVRLEHRLKPGGLVLFSTDLDVVLGAGGEAVTADVLCRFCGMVQERTTLRFAGGIDWSLSDATLDRVARSGTDEAKRPHFAVVKDGGIRITAVLCLRKDL